MATPRGPRARKIWFLYLLECANGSVYTGIALDVKARFAEHCAGKGAKYTRANPPKKILGTKKFRTRSAASKAEWQVKQLSKEAKRAFAKALPKVLPLAALFYGGAALAASAPMCIVRVAPLFSEEHARALNSRGYTVITDPSVKSDDFQGFLGRYVLPGEYTILTGGFLRGGFELWARGGKEPVLARWRWFASTASVIRDELPLCSDFLGGRGK